MQADTGTQLRDAAAAADVAVREAIEQRKRSVQLHKFATLLHQNNQTAWTQRFTSILEMLREDAARQKPLHLLSQPSGTGVLLLTSLLNFLMIQGGYYLRVCKEQVFQLSGLLAYSPPPNMRDHPEERNALARLTATRHCDTTLLWSLVDALLQRGAHIDGRHPTSHRTVLQEWVLSGADDGLLERGADIGATHADSTVVSSLSQFGSVDRLRQLIEKGWLDTVDIDMQASCRGNLAPTAFLHSQENAPTNQDIPSSFEKRCQLQAVQHNWLSHVRPAILRLLEAHDQLAPVLAEIIVSYVRQ